MFESLGNISRKFNFETNTKDIPVRLSTQSDPVLLKYRIMMASKIESKREKINLNISVQDLIFNSLMLWASDNLQGCSIA